MLRLSDTIAAIATPPGEGGIGVIRLSGPLSFQIADQVFHGRSGKPSELSSHTLHYGFITDPGTGEQLDDAVILLFRNPHSFTGEDVVEFSCHGGPVTLGRVLALVLRLAARAAEPGEFTHRAFLNGRMDLAQAEAICDQIRAKTESAQRLAVLHRQGRLSKEVTRLKDDLVGALAAVEVTIDFSEEVGDLDYDAISARLASIRGGVEALIATAGQGRVYREGIRLAIVGRPNAGKSSLLNALLREERAIVTPIAGTTRDVIEETANIRGIPITAIDTAGLREAEDVVERMGVERAKEAMEGADLLLFVIDAAAAWTEAESGLMTEVGGRSVIWVISKVDLINTENVVQWRSFVPKEVADHAVFVSATTGEGLDRLEEAIADAVLGGLDIGEGIVVSNVRHQRALETARDSLLEAEKTTAAHLPPDFISIDLRGALDALGQITGETATDEIIHRIFQDFCIGK